uniref:Serine/threonine specific protein phosphatases domain-containing protein n=1 Tax=Panagrolaimus sp. JU765 TaxID=591449 RepID=A0AC34Q014_9BILA
MTEETKLPMMMETIQTAVATGVDGATVITSGMSYEKATPEPLVQNIWNYILGFTGSAPPCYAAKPMLHILREAEAILKVEPTVLNLRGPVTIIGGVHGQGDNLVSLMAHGGFPPSSTYVFLGNYAGPGFAPHEVLFMLLAWKIKFPKNIYLLKGSLEDAEVLKSHDFLLGLQRRQLFDDVLVWAYIEQILQSFPLAAIVNDFYFLVSGGIGPELCRQGLNGLRNVQRPPRLTSHMAMTLECQWACLKMADDGETATDGSPLFTEAMVAQFCKDNKLKLIIRSRQIVAEGILNYPEQMLTIWSAMSYLDSFRNAACGIRLNPDFNKAVVFQIIQHEEDPKSLDEAKPAPGRNVIQL